MKTINTLKKCAMCMRSCNLPPQGKKTLAIFISPSSSIVSFKVVPKEEQKNKGTQLDQACTHINHMYLK